MNEQDNEQAKVNSPAGEQTGNQPGSDEKSDNDNRNDNRNAVLAVAVAGTIQVAETDGPFDCWDMIAGIIMLLILSTYRLRRDSISKEADPNATINRLVLASVWGLCCTIILGLPVQLIVNHINKQPAGTQVESAIYGAIWVVITTISYIVIEWKQKQFR